MDSICRKIAIRIAFAIMVLVILLMVGRAGAVPAEEWNRSYEGTANSAIQTSDGGYIVVGYASESYGNADVKVVKTDANGNLQWSTKYGGSREDIANAIQQTKDGGYIIAGSTYSYGAGLSDAWIIKTDSNGKELWNRTFGGKEDEYAFSVQQTPDEGYIITGKTHSYGTGSDAWLIKTDPKGNEVWNRTFRTGKDPDVAGTVKVTADGGYIFSGSSFYYAWLIKTDANGLKQWNKTLKSDGATIQQTSDGGYILAGLIGVFSPHGTDAWLSKIDANGNELWNRTFGGNKPDGFGSVQQTSDGGYILAGSTCSFNLQDNCDAWLVKTDANGNEKWNRTFGDVNEEQFRSVQETSDGGYILAGGTWGVRTPTTATNFWLVKVGPKEAVVTPTMFSTPIAAESPVITAITAISATPTVVSTPIVAESLEKSRVENDSGIVINLGQPVKGKSNIWALTAGTNGKIFGGTGEGGMLFVYDPNTNKSENIGEVLGEGAVYSLTTDEKGLVYGGTAWNSKLFSYNPLNKSITYLGQPIENGGIICSLVAMGSDIYGSTCDGGDSTYVGSHLFVYNSTARMFTDLGQPIAGERGSKICSGKDGRIYGGTSPKGYLFSYDPANNSFTIIGQPVQREATAYPIITGNDGKIYFSLNESLYVLNPTNSNIDNLFKLSKYIHKSGEFFWSLTVGLEGNIYGGTAPSGYLFNFNPSDDSVSFIRPLPEETRIRTLTTGIDGKIYGGTGWGAYLFSYKVPKKAIGFEAVLAIIALLAVYIFGRKYLRLN